MPSGYVGPVAPMHTPTDLRPSGNNKRKPSIWVRLRVLLKRLDLDAALAEGANPTSSGELALRAEQLGDPGQRNRLATGIENLFRMATMGPGPEATVSLVRAPFDPARVAANEPELAELAEILRREGPHNVRGLAMASVLIEDSDSPLYDRTAPDQLKPAIAATISALER